LPERRAGVAALVVGLGLSATLLLLLVAADRSVRAEADLPTTARVVGVIPRLRPDRVLKRAGSDATRRAIGFAAGAALPAPPGAP
jgi:microcompartment protein CcmK/EutM